jgi:hypothetical protein
MSGRVMSLTSSLRAQRSNPPRHCERSEAIQKLAFERWIASSLTLLAMTALMQFNRAILKS